ncbi:MAG: hypothetical protein KGL95_05875 [Patescibacteria group bacterium]|nr:hypothetical protein [Patescibacteria group bacterium]
MKGHITYYISLVLLLIAGFGGALFATGQKPLQMGLIVLAAVFYCIWGIMHHVIHHSFSVKIMLEYIAIATLGISLVFFVLNVGL